jgi:hypothetical protein
MTVDFLTQFVRKLLGVVPRHALVLDTHQIVARLSEKPSRLILSCGVTGRRVEVERTNVIASLLMPIHLALVNAVPLTGRFRLILPRHRLTGPRFEFGYASGLLLDQFPCLFACSSRAR